MDTINAGAHKDITINIPSGTIPSGHNLTTAYILTTPNSAWVFANITGYSNTQIRIGAYNTYTSALSGKYTIIIFYK